MTDLLGLYDADGLSVQIEQIVGVTMAGLQGKLSNGDSGLRDILLAIVTDNPSRLFKQAIDFLSGLCLRGQFSSLSTLLFEFRRAGATWSSIGTSDPETAPAA